MVPDSYHDLFLACAGVAGALIGLLFVAITVRPEDATRGSARQRLRPAAALSAFLNALFVSLLALFPEDDMSHGFTAIALVSVAAVLGMLVFLVLELRTAGFGQWSRAVLSVLVQLGTSVVQLVAALRLSERPDSPGPVMVIGITVLIMFSSGIDRAWEFVGATNTGLITTVAHAVAGHHGPHEGHGPGGHADRDVSGDADVPGDSDRPGPPTDGRATT